MEHETIVRDGWTDGWMEDGWRTDGWRTDGQMDAKAESEKKTDAKTDRNTPSK